MIRKLLFLGALALAPIFAQEEKGHEGKEAAEHAKEAKEEALVPWKWANFAILAVVLGIIAKKQLGAAFTAKSAEIRKGIADAAAMKADAERRIAEIDARVNALGVEVEKIRTQSAAEMQREGERIRQETAVAIGKIEQQATFEIESAGKAARRDLKNYAADLAVEQAEARLRTQINAASEGALIDNFLSDLSRQGSKN